MGGIAVTDSALSLIWDSTRLRLLVEIGRQGSVSAAARTIGIGQPTASEHLRTLEGAAGQRLVERNGRGSTLTEAGKLLALHAGQALQTLGAGEEALHRLSGLEAGTIHIGASTTPGVYLLPIRSAAFAATTPTSPSRSRSLRPARSSTGCWPGVCSSRSSARLRLTSGSGSSRSSATRSLALPSPACSRSAADAPAPESSPGRRFSSANRGRAPGASASVRLRAPASGLAHLGARLERGDQTGCARRARDCLLLPLRGRRRDRARRAGSVPDRQAAPAKPPRRPACADRSRPASVGLSRPSPAAAQRTRLTGRLRPFGAPPQDRAT